MFENGIAVLTPPVESDGPTLLLESARLEFQASLQLLADRACWVSGARGGAIALEANGVMTYEAVAGVCDCEAGAPVPIEAEAMRECLAGKSVRVATVGQEPTFAMAFPVVQDENGQDEKIVGGLELVSDREFTGEEQDRASRIAELVTVILEHRDAAERAGRMEFREKELAPPSLWHVPEEASKPAPAQLAKNDLEKPADSKRGIAQVRGCTACGFPVSPARTLCVDCERKSESVPVPTELFAIAAEESWLSAHGYTIASILVTALTVVLIFWLRHH
jgi:hypothetical protein